MLNDKIKSLFSNRINKRFLLNPFIKMQINSLKDYPGINNSYTRETPIIVSLTSNRENYKNLSTTIYSLLNQSLKPDRIILWLDEDCEDLTYLPYEITKFVKNGLEIRFIKDLGPYNKWFYAFKEFGNSIIVTAEDNIFYQTNWLKLLYLSYIAHPNDIHVHKAHTAKLNTPYKKWKKNINIEKAQFSNFIVNYGGVLYPPKCFSKEIFRKDIFLKNVPNQDNIWVWVMSLVHNKKIRIVQNHIKTLVFSSFCDFFINQLLTPKTFYTKTDEQLNNLLKYYKLNIINKIK